MSEVFRLPWSKNPELLQPETESPRAPQFPPVGAYDRLYGTVSQQVEVSLEALRELGLLEDEERDRQLLADQYLELRASGFHGELYPQISLSPTMVSFDALLEVLDNRRHPLGEPAVVGSVWRDGYTIDQLNALGVGEPEDELPIHGRLAVANLNTLGANEPLLHFQGHPFDEQTSRIVLVTNPREPSQEITISVPTQQEMLARSQENVRTMYAGYNLAGLNLPAMCVIMLQRRIQGAPLPLQHENYMHIPQLSRVHHPGSRDEVGYVASMSVIDDQLHLGVSRDVPRMTPHGGLGLSLGRNLSE